MYDFDKSLGRVTQQVSKMLGQILQQRFADRELSVTSTQWSVLSLLSKKEPLTQKEIGEYLVMDKVQTMRVVEQLEKRGWLQRKVSESDRRANVVSLTNAGKQLYAELVPIAETVLEDALSVLESQETQTLSLSLERVYLQLKKIQQSNNY